MSFVRLKWRDIAAGASHADGSANVPRTPVAADEVSAVIDEIRSLSDVWRKMPSEHHARMFLEGLVWADGRRCPLCGGVRSTRLRGEASRPGLYQCCEAGCRRQFTVTTRSPLHATKLDLWVWISAMVLVLTSSKGISSVVMARLLGVSRKTAWKMGHAIRELMADRGGEYLPLSGEVEVDEASIGGAACVAGPRARAAGPGDVEAARARGGLARRPGARLGRGLNGQGATLGFGDCGVGRCAGHPPDDRRQSGLHADRARHGGPLHGDPQPRGIREPHHRRARQSPSERHRSERRWRRGRHDLQHPASAGQRPSQTRGAPPPALPRRDRRASGPTASPPARRRSNGPFASGEVRTKTTVLWTPIPMVEQMRALSSSVPSGGRCNGRRATGCGGHQGHADEAHGRSIKPHTRHLDSGFLTCPVATDDN